MLFKFVRLLSVGMALLFLISCERDKETVVNNIWNLRGNANGAQEAPTRVTTPATGTISGTYDRSSNLLTYTITWTGLIGGNASAMHFHGPADPGVAATVAVGISNFTPGTSGTVSGTATLTDAQETDLMNGLWYYNIHNSTYPAGEIRGQVFLTQ